MHIFDLERYALDYQSSVTRELAHDRWVDAARRTSPALRPGSVVRDRARDFVQQALTHLPAGHSRSPISAAR